MSGRPRIVAIAGGSASGKSTLSAALVDQLGDRAGLILHDRYYRSPPAETEVSTWNFDHPDSLDTPLLVAHLDALRDGRAVDVPRYDFAQHCRAGGTDRVMPAPLIVVEGILVLADADLRARCDVSIFVDTAADIRLARRIRRDVLERGREPLGILERYLSMVRPMHEAYVEPSKRHADLIIDGTDALATLVGGVRTFLQV